MSPEPESLLVATITLARDAAEAKLILNTLTKLSNKDISTIYATDGGSAEPGFVDSLKKIKKLHLFQDKDGGLFNQVKRSLSDALKNNCQAILYLESNKEWFVEERLEKFLNRSQAIIKERGSNFGIIVAGRTDKSFQSFPEVQQKEEAKTNERLSALTGCDFDYCYGPRIISMELVQRVLEIDTDIGWGWLCVPVVLASKLGRSIDQVELDLFCPKDEQIETEKDIKLRQAQREQHFLAIDLAET